MVVAQYEALPGAVLGNALPPEARPGLLLFLRHGMSRWAGAVTTMSAPPRPAGYRPPNWKIPEEHRAVVHILAAMAINANHYGATP
jgi:hypothetical protein